MDRCSVPVNWHLQHLQSLLADWPLSSCRAGINGVLISWFAASAGKPALQQQVAHLMELTGAYSISGLLYCFLAGRKHRMGSHAGPGITTMQAQICQADQQLHFMPPVNRCSYFDSCTCCTTMLHQHAAPVCCRLSALLHQYAAGLKLPRCASRAENPPLASMPKPGMLPAGKDLRSIFMLLKRDPKTGAVPAHAGLLLHMMCTMARHEGPTAYFDFANEVRGCLAEFAVCG